MTQRQKIIELCKDEAWHCQNEFRALYAFSPHKRRSEIEAMGDYKFIPRKCEHGVRGQKDYRMVSIKESLNNFCCISNTQGKPHDSYCKILQTINQPAKSLF